MTNDYSYLIEDSEASTDTLNKLQELVNQYEDLQAAIDDAEKDLASLKRQLAFLSGTAIPEILAQSNLSELKLWNGKKVEVRNDLSVTVNDFNAFADFLRERGDDDILKWSLDFGKVPDTVKEDILNFAYDKYHLAPEVKDTVHPQTLKKYVKELTGMSKMSRDSVPINELPDCLSVYPYFKTTIK